MADLLSVLTATEKISLSLRALYAEKGYGQYKMSKFEEYDLYAKNKEFLTSDSVITFTDTDGRLLALKPDVTLSIIKNTKESPEGKTKVYYNENVYRLHKGTGAFRELAQVGVETMGDVTEKDVVETLLLAKESLNLLSDATVLEVSHLDVVTGLAQAYGLSAQGKQEFFLALADKNEQAARSVAEAEGLTPEQTENLALLTTLYGKAEQILPLLSRFGADEKTKTAVQEFSTVLTALLNAGAENVYVDFSVLNHQNYYNGIAFKGFVKGVPTGVLSGGQYDRLMQKMKKHSKGIGFAVYPDELVKIYAGERK